MTSHFDDADPVATTTKLIQAVMDSDVWTIRALVQNETVNVNGADKRGYTALHWAAERGLVSMAKELYTREDLIVDLPDLCGSTPLHAASLAGQLEMVKFLTERGAAPNTRKTNGKTPLHEASWYGHKEVVRALLEAGASPHLVDFKLEQTPLEMARSCFNDDVATILEDWIAAENATRYKGELDRRVSEWAFLKDDAVGRRRDCGATSPKKGVRITEPDGGLDDGASTARPESPMIEASSRPGTNSSNRSTPSKPPQRPESKRNDDVVSDVASTRLPRSSVCSLYMTASGTAAPPAADGILMPPPVPFKCHCPYCVADRVRADAVAHQERWKQFTK